MNVGLLLIVDICWRLLVLFGIGLGLATVAGVSVRGALSKRRAMLLVRVIEDGC